MTESGSRRLKLTFVGTGESIQADMLDDEAPGICDLIWDMLPIEQPAIHGRYSGAEIFTLLDNPQDVPPENSVHLPLPGEIFYFFDPGGTNATGRTPQGEICVVYDRGVALRGPEGLPTFCSLFARIPGDWKTDWRDFAAACARVRRDGPQRLRLDRAG
jgi:hypothetical protein